MMRILCVMLISTLASFGQTTVKQDPATKAAAVPSDLKTLDTLNYTIQYPPTWRLDQSGQLGTSFFLFSPKGTTDDKFSENVNLIIQDLTGHNIDLDKYVEISEGQIKTMITNSVMVESKRIKGVDNEYHREIYTGDQGLFHLKFEQYYWVIKDHAYVLTLTCEQTTYTDFKETGETILNSFAIKN